MRFKVIQGHQFRYQSKTRMRLATSELILAYILSRTVSEISRNISQMVAADGGRLSLTHSFGVNT